MPLSDICNCLQADLWNVLDAEDVYQRDVWFLSKGVGEIELCQLGQMLGVDTYANLKAGFQLVGEPRSEGPWPQTIPRALTDKLVNLGDDEIKGIVVQWSAIEEFRGAVSQQSLVEYLANVRTFLKGRTGDFFLVNAL